MIKFGTDYYFWNLLKLVIIIGQFLLQIFSQKGKFRHIIRNFKIFFKFDFWASFVIGQCITNSLKITEYIMISVIFLYNNFDNNMRKNTLLKKFFENIYHCRNSRISNRSCGETIKDIELILLGDIFCNILAIKSYSFFPTFLKFL